MSRKKSRHFRKIVYIVHSPRDSVSRSFSYTLVIDVCSIQLANEALLANRVDQILNGVVRERSVSSQKHSGVGIENNGDIRERSVSLCVR